MAEQGEGVGIGVAQVKHALIASLSVVGSKEDQKLLVSFMSGEGEIVNDYGETLDPLLFTLEILPHTDRGIHEMTDMLTAWKNSDTPLDVTVREDSAIFYSPEEQRVIRISF